MSIPVAVTEKERGERKKRLNEGEIWASYCHSDKSQERVPYYMKFWRYLNLANLAIFQKIAKLKCTKIKCR